MKYNEFKNLVIKFPFFTSSQLGGFVKDCQLLRNQLYLWQKRGLIIKLKKGLYMLGENERKIEPSPDAIASHMVAPSYISMEYALSRYDLIPEGVFTVTSITTKKTQTIRNNLGTFAYQHIKEKCFVGFKQEKDSNGLTFFMAEPEKALVDFFYLRSHDFKENDKDVFKESFRFQNTENLDKNKLIRFGALFGNKKIMKVIDNFCQAMGIGE